MLRNTSYVNQTAFRIIGQLKSKVVDGRIIASEIFSGMILSRKQRCNLQGFAPNCVFLCMRLPQTAHRAGKVAYEPPCESTKFPKFSDLNSRFKRVIPLS